VATNLLTYLARRTGRTIRHDRTFANLRCLNRSDEVQAVADIRHEDIAAVEAFAKPHLEVVRKST
jgi:hypothetical protein